MTKNQKYRKTRHNVDGHEEQSRRTGQKLEHEINHRKASYEPDIHFDWCV